MHRDKSEWNLVEQICFFLINLAIFSKNLWLPLHGCVGSNMAAVDSWWNWEMCSGTWSECQQSALSGFLMKQDSLRQHGHELRHVSAFICFNNGLFSYSFSDDSLQTDCIKSSPPPHLCLSVFFRRSSKVKLPGASFRYFEFLFSFKVWSNDGAHRGASFVITCVLNCNLNRMASMAEF